MMQGLGVAMGERLLEAGPANPRGYFEDVDFLTLQRQMLVAATRTDDGGHPDWGWTEREQLDTSAFEPFVPQARALLAARAVSGGAWGWKDPRTTLLLDFWKGLVPEACHVLVYRHPWAVAESMQQLGAEVFLRHPDYAYRIWAFYNRRLLDFYRRNRDRALLLSVDALGREPGRLAQLVVAKLGVTVADPGRAGPFEHELLHSFPPVDPLVSLVAAAHPRCAELLSQLDTEADLSGAATWRARPIAAPPSDGSRLSVVIPCYDQGEFLIEAVASVERCVPEPYELIVVNDGSGEPRTLEVLDVLRAGGYRIVDQPNGGLSAARNRGASEAKGPYLLPLDADNRLCDGFAREAIRILDEQPQVGVVYGDRREFGMRAGRARVPPFNLPILLAGNYIDACTVIRRQVWSDNGGFDGAMPHPGWEDWDLWIGTAARGWGFEYLPFETLDYRVRPGSMITAFEDKKLRQQVLAYLANKHRAVFVANMAEVLSFVQDCSHGAWVAARAREAAEQARAVAERASEAAIAKATARQGELDRREAELDLLEAELERLRAELAAGGLDRLRAELAASEGQRPELADRFEDVQEDRALVRAERERLRLELLSWQQRTRELEGTRTFRWRARLIAIKRRLRPLQGG
jgi:hypothetical protein